MSEEAELPSPAATIVSRRASRSAMPERLKVAARDDSSDDEWDPEEVAGASDEEDSDAEDSGADGGAKRGRVTAHYIVQRSSGLEEHDDRRKSLAEKTWARRSVVAHNVSACGAANFEAVPGRERAAEWEKNMLEFAEDNFNDALASRYERRAVERQRARWHDPVLRRWLGLTPKRPALCLRGLQKVIARECSEEMIFCRACGKCRRVAAAYGIADKG